MENVPCIDDCLLKVAMFQSHAKLPEGIHMQKTHMDQKHYNWYIAAMILVLYWVK